MNALAERPAQRTVALLGPADDARAQLRQSLVALGAELVFEGELAEATGLGADGSVPDVLLVNLEPGVEDELDALQALLDHPEVSVVFNEGEVSSRLTGWDLARWARHLAAKVLGVSDTLPPPPQGAARLPVLDLMPEPGRPASPAQQQEHLRFDDYADEALDLQAGVPSSPRLEHVQPEPPATPAPAEAPSGAQVDAGASGFDFDFSPVAPEVSADAGESPVDGPQAEAVSESDLEQVDLESVFEQGLDALSPEDLLLRLQAAMGLEPRTPAGSAAVEASPASMERSEAPIPPAAEQPLEGFDFEAAELPADAPPAASAREPEAAEWVVDASVPEPDAASTLSEAANGLDFSVDSEEVSFDFEAVDPLASDSTQQTTAAAETRSEADQGQSDFSEFDFSSHDDDAQARFSSDDDSALGGTLTLESSADDDEIARLAAALDAAEPALPPSVEVDPLDFSHLRTEPEPGRKAEPVVARRPETPAPEQAPSAAAAARSGFGDLSLAPLDTDPQPSAPTPAPAASSFDFSGIELSLEPIEGEEPEPAPAPQVRAPAQPDSLAMAGSAAAQAPSSEASAVPVADSEASTAADDALLAADASGSETQAAAAAVAPAAVAPAAAGISRVVVLCASIGGPDALRSFLDGLPSGFPALFLVVQHLESGYFERLAQQLQKASKLPVRVPIAGTQAQDGEVLVVTSEHRLQVASDGAIELAPLESASRYRPCIDDVLRDVADTFGDRAVAVIFSGMAADAVEGAVYLTSRGGEVWAQDPESCVVSSMVDGARARGVVEFIGSPRELAAHCMRRLRF